VVAPRASRPHMPGYGIVAADEGRGLLPWSWAEERLVRSREFWVATVGGGSPHLTPVWGVWRDGAVWFSCSPGGRKARDLAVNPACTVATADPHEPVVVEGRADAVGDPSAVAAHPAEIHYLLGVLKHYFPHTRALGEQDLIASFAGVRVLPGGSGHAFHRSRETQLILDREVRPRVLSIYGGKLTTWRAVCARALARIAASLPPRRALARTDALPLSPE